MHAVSRRQCKCIAGHENPVNTTPDRSMAKRRAQGGDLALLLARRKLTNRRSCVAAKAVTTFWAGFPAIKLKDRCIALPSVATTRFHLRRDRQESWRSR
jgi:hypothetical protein